MLIAKKLLDTRGPSLAATQIEQFRATGFRGPIWATGNGQDKRIDCWGSLSSVEGQSPLHQCRLALVRLFLKKAVKERKKGRKEERKKGRKEERKKGRPGQARTKVGPAHIKPTGASGKIACGELRA
jgi:hypothetical protein